MIVDLGCGRNKRGDVGIDVVGPPTTKADYVCNLGFEPIPLPNDVADRVVAFDFMEHVPFCVWTDAGHRRTPVISLVNEIWRILKHGGEFEMRSPAYPMVEAFRDPTHVSFWTLETLRYFTNGYGSFLTEAYGITARFRIVENKMDGSHLHAVLQAIKDPNAFLDELPWSAEMDTPKLVLSNEQERLVWALQENNDQLEAIVRDKDKIITLLERLLEEKNQEIHRLRNPLLVRLYRKTRRIVRDVARRNNRH
ncbi:MAG TPA: hypothetical protein VKX96_16335 [Chloroflexota bacterium]|nr:hypothetical protein [Chloroflexota bacterium]